MALITDAMAAAGVGDGCYELGALAVTVAGGVARLTGTDTIAGSTLTQDAAVRTAHHDAGATLQQAIAAVTAVPANALGLADRFGALAPGYVADVVALDAELRVRAVWAGGRPPRGRGFGRARRRGRVLTAPQGGRPSTYP